MMRWNYFISHASEDKKLVVEPFAHYLRSADFSVWYDDFSLKIGDSLFYSISQGLRNSDYGIVLLSKNFFNKRWPQQELASLFALEQGKVRILPVWHALSAADVAEHATMLADRKAASTQHGLQRVAEQIVAASYPERLSSLPLSSAKKTEQDEFVKARSFLAEILEKTKDVKEIYLYLSGYPILLARLAGYDPIVIPGYKLTGGR
jgi:hypothetical protein